MLLRWAVCAQHVGARGLAGGSSGRWKERQRKDPYAKAARANPQLKSRASFKLKEIDAKHKLLRRGDHVVDLGSFPGGWAYVAREAVGHAECQMINGGFTKSSIQTQSQCASASRPSSTRSIPRPIAAN